jgi:hypothetical protein
MRTLALALLASVLGTGCIIHDNDTVNGGGDPVCLPSTITVAWSNFTAGDGAQLGCAAAGVEWVDIFMNGTPVETWNCADGGAIITDVLSGSYLLTIEGVEANGRIAFRDEQNVTSSGCGDRLVFAEPAEGFVALQYTFSPVNQCAGTVADPSYLWFSVFDVAANATTAAVDANSTLAEKRLYACSLDLVFPLPSGAHELDWMQEMVETSLGVFSVTGAQCALTPFEVPRGGTVGVPVVMADASVSCL